MFFYPKCLLLAFHLLFELHVMTIQEIYKTYNRIIGSLDCKELKNAFDYIQGLIAGTRKYSFQDRLNELQDTYKYMLRYRVEGVKDPMQEQIYKNLIASSYELADTLRHQALAVDSPLTFYSYRRIGEKKEECYNQIHKTLSITSDKDLRTNPQAQMETQLQFEAALISLFNKIWTSDALKKDEEVCIREIIRDDELPFIVGCQIVSALIMGLQAAFDENKLTLLFDTVNHENEEVRIRALIGILLTLYTYRKRTYLYPWIEERLCETAEHFNGFTKALRTITLHFILARETEKISRKLQNEIIPEMIKLEPKLKLKDFNPDLPGEDMNPEWQNILANSTLEKKMMEFNELQQEGADVMHSTFTHLKSFPFFREVSNWFLPFTTQHSALRNISNNLTESKALNSMSLAISMCNSDKYSLFLSMMQLPEQARQMMMGEFNGQAIEMLQQNREDTINKNGSFDIISRQYIQDLYRFFKSYPSHLDFDDIFSLPLDFHNLSLLQPYINDEESLTTIAEFYLRKNYFDDALTVYNKLSQAKKEGSDVLFQKIGYCKQMDNDIAGALEAYLKADLINPDSKWTIRRIAGCYRTLKQPKEALLYYHRYESLKPGDLSIQISIGHCHLELKNYNEALKYYFKVDYLDNDNTKAWRPIAWCSFLTGKFEQARNYYEKIINNKPNTQDFLNAGHTEWALKNIKKSIDFYQKAIQKESGNFAKFLELFNSDMPDLIAAGIEEEEIPLMLDQLRYSISE